MKPILPIFIMVDACGWEIIRDDPFLAQQAPQRTKLRSVFGYSSTCVPSILSGHWPDEHRNWCYFVHAPEKSPFRFLRPLRWLPKALTSRRIVRRMLTKLVKSWLGFKGYFDLYNIPFQHIASYDFTEKKSPLQPNGMNRGTNIFDFLCERKIPYFVSDPDVSEETNRDTLAARIAAKDITARLQGDDEALETFDRFQQHLLDNKVDPATTKITLGPKLTLAGKEVFSGERAAEANKLTTREYRAPYIVPQTADL